MKNPEVVMLGLGYIGLPTAALIAKNKTKVHGVDINQNVPSISIVSWVTLPNPTSPSCDRM